VDLHFTSAVATAQERAAIDAASGTGGAPRSQRHLLLPVLHAVQDSLGWISPGALNYASERLGVAPADAYGVATFYKLFSMEERPRRVIHVCDDIACAIAGAQKICDEMECSGAAFERSPCLGLCDRAPATLVIEAGVKQTPPAPATAPHVGGSDRQLLARVGKVDPESLDSYLAHDGYTALRAAFGFGPARVVAESSASNLLGRGGAAFPTAKKMEAVASAAARPHYLICNADESEPGTFKDRVLMEHDPFATVEAMTIAAYATGCEHAYIYVRGEYPLAARRIGNAIAQTRAAGLLGDDILGTGVRLEIEIRRGAGAYICGEETALFNSIEGKRGEPRSKPPFPVESGLFGKPTLVNNVETLANLLPILRDGAAEYARRGTAESTGTRLFSLSGNVAKPGVYEVAHGTRLGDVIEMAGGVPPPHRLQAILLGGAAGAIVAPDALSMRLSFEAARASGATLGSGVVMLFDDSVEMLAILKRIARFFRDESCGQCVPCRVGTVRQEEALERRDFVLLDEIGRAMRDASICGLGQTAAGAIASARANLKLW
jgi:NADH-quinone oxidoreductase subunit F